jgi:hypothetical protein
VGSIVMGATLVLLSSGTPTRLVQLLHPDEGPRAALVHNDELHLLATYRSLYSFAQAALSTGWRLRDLLSTDLSGIVLDYDQVYRLQTPWRFRPCFDHPTEPGRCVVSSAGRSTSGTAWKYIASGASLRGHGESLPVAGSPDLAAVYLIASDGLPRRVGITAANRSRVSAIGPELILDPALPRFAGVVTSGPASNPRTMELSAEVPLLLALASIEPDHFESADFRRTGDVHIHFFGERLFHSSAPLDAGEGEQIGIEFEHLGPALLNTIHFEELAAWRVAATPL